MESRPTTEVSNVSTAGELTVDSATRVSSPTLAMRRPYDESRPEISVRTLRSHSRGGRSSTCVQEPPGQAGNVPLCRESLMDRATRPNNPSSEPEMLPDRPLPTSVDMDPSPPPLVIASSDTPLSLVPTDASDEASASFHSTPDFHYTPQIPSSHAYLEVPTTTGPNTKFYTGPTPVASHTGPDQNQKLYNSTARSQLRGTCPCRYPDCTAFRSRPYNALGNTEALYGCQKFAPIRGSAEPLPPAGRRSKYNRFSNGP